MLQKFERQPYVAQVPVSDAPRCCRHSMPFYATILIRCRHYADADAARCHALLLPARPPPICHDAAYYYAARRDTAMRRPILV